AQSAAGCGSTVHGYADVRARSDQYPVCEVYVSIGSQSADIKDQNRALAGRIRDGRSIQLGAARLVDKSRRQIVRYLYVSDRRGEQVLNLHVVINKSTDLSLGLRCGFLHEQRRCCRGIERHIEDRGRAACRDGKCSVVGSRGINVAPWR